MKSLFDTEPYTEIRNRLEALDADQTPRWGRMNPAQMMHHCQKAFEVPLGKSDLKRPNMFMRMLFKRFKKSLYNDTPWKQNLPTAKQFRVTNAKDFEKEKAKLLDLMQDFHAKGTAYDWPEHPAFGNFTTAQWGQMQYKHMDHHLRQFGV
jgi:hypothetical protein